MAVPPEITSHLRSPAPASPGKDLLLVGGGHSHVIVLKEFGRKPMPGVRLTVVSREVLTPYSGMLPGLVAGHYKFHETHIDLAPLARFAGARLIHDEVIGLDLAARRAFCRSNPPIPYDVISIDIGSTPDMTEVPGAAEHAVPVKPISNFMERWERLKARVLAATGTVRIGVVGAGAGGVELTLAMQYALERSLSADDGQLSPGHLTQANLEAVPKGTATAVPPEPPKRGASGPEVGRPGANVRMDETASKRLEFYLFSATGILPTHNEKVQAKFRRVLAERGVSVHEGSSVAAVGAGSLRLANGEEFPLDEILWVTQARAAAWLKEAGLRADARGFVEVADTLESLSHPGVFAAGDVAAVVNHPREKAGVFAVRQGKPLQENLRRALRGEPLRPFIPQRKFLGLISTGDRCAIASRANWSLEGRFVWTIKDWIDRRFMAKYQLDSDLTS